VTDLVLLRHGRTAWNAERRIQGQSESTLDEVGHAQAAATAPVLARLAPSVLWSSDSVRAQETTTYVAEALEMQARLDPRLREYSLGEREGLTHQDFAQVAPDEHAAFAAGHWDLVPSAERFEAVQARMCAAIEEALAAATASGPGPVLLVSHGAAIRTATAMLLGWTREQHASLRALENCGWVVLRREPGQSWRLVAYNRVADYRSPATVG
jgi:broad specificity phosphatase PhoE